MSAIVRSPCAAVDVATQRTLYKQTAQGTSITDYPIYSKYALALPVAPTRRLPQDRPDVGLATLVDRILIIKPSLKLIPEKVLRQNRAAKNQAMELQSEVFL